MEIHPLLIPTYLLLGFAILLSLISLKKDRSKKPHK